MYAVVCFMLLWVLFQGFFIEASIDQSVFILQKKEDLDHKKINKEFTKHRSESKYEIYNISDSEKLLDTLDAMQKSNIKYVINLYVDDFYQTNYNQVLNKGYTWAGDIFDTNQDTKQIICRSNLAVKKNGNETCNNVRIDRRKHSKVVSQSVIDDLPYLYNLVYNFKAKTPQIIQTKYIEYKVSVCDATFKPENQTIQNTTKDFIVIKYESRCDAGDKNIAILSPNPDAIEETNVPVIFYEQLALPSDNVFKYNVTRDKPSATSYAVLTDFIWNVGWRRVAILSDESAESVDYENKLRKLFRKYGISYTVEREEKCCDFTKTLTSLKMLQARAIIANVDETHAIALMKKAKAMGMTKYNNVVWIARNWSQKTAMDITEPVFTMAYERATVGDQVSALKTIFDTHKQNIFKNNQLFLHYNLLSKYIRSEKTFTNPMKLVIKTGKHWSTVTSKNRLNLPRDRADCILPTNNYYKPCADIDLVYIVLVILVFVVTVLGVFFFFDTPNAPPLTASVTRRLYKRMR